MSRRTSSLLGILGVLFVVVALLAGVIALAALYFSFGGWTDGGGSIDSGYVANRRWTAGVSFVVAALFGSASFVISRNRPGLERNGTE